MTVRGSVAVLPELRDDSGPLRTVLQDGPPLRRCAPPLRAVLQNGFDGSSVIPPSCKTATEPRTVTAKRSRRPLRHPPLCKTAPALCKTATAPTSVCKTTEICIPSEATPFEATQKTLLRPLILPEKILPLWRPPWLYSRFSLNWILT